MMMMQMMAVLLVAMIAMPNLKTTMFMRKMMMAITIRETAFLMESQAADDNDRHGDGDDDGEWTGNAWC